MLLSFLIKKNKYWRKKNALQRQWENRQETGMLLAACERASLRLANARQQHSSPTPLQAQMASLLSSRSNGAILALHLCIRSRVWTNIGSQIQLSVPCRKLLLCELQPGSREQNMANLLQSYLYAPAIGQIALYYTTIYPGYFHNTHCCKNWCTSQ